MQKQEATLYDQYGHAVFFQAEDGAAVTASDSTVFAPGVLYIGTGGDVNLRTRQGTTLLFASVPTGSFLPVIADMVYSTSTTASDILVLR